MFDTEDAKRIAQAATELNSLLQQISRYSDLARQHRGEHNYIELLAERVDLASNVAQKLFDTVTGKIMSTNPAVANKASAGAVTTPRPAPTFSVLPTPAATKKTAEVPKAPTSSVFPIRNPTGRRELILIVEDELEVAELAADLLAEEGYKTILAKDGFEALNIYGALGAQIDLVMLDFFLPVMDGDAVFDELRALNPNINVVLSSGFAEQTKLGQMLALGLRGFIPKPYTLEKLVQQVRSALDAGRQQQAS